MQLPLLERLGVSAEVLGPEPVSKRRERGDFGGEHRLRAQATSEVLEDDRNVGKLLQQSTKLQQ